jgi:hypothetical protein
MPATKIGPHRNVHDRNKAVPIAVTSSENGDVPWVVA